MGEIMKLMPPLTSHLDAWLRLCQCQSPEWNCWAERRGRVVNGCLGFLSVDSPSIRHIIYMGYGVLDWPPEGTCIHTFYSNWPAGTHVRPTPTYILTSPQSSFNSLRTLSKVMLVSFIQGLTYTVSMIILQCARLSNSQAQSHIHSCHY